MIYQGTSLSLSEIDAGLYALHFDLADSSVNKLSTHTLSEIDQAITVLYGLDNLKGLLLKSGKRSFFVGADITEFLGMFQLDEAEFIEKIHQINRLFCRLEDLPCPTVVAINGEAFGGGLELCLACDYRVMGKRAKIALPEVKLGIMPGWGGTVRLPRLIGLDNAVEWICTGSAKKSAEALKHGAVDAVVDEAELHDSALDLLKRVVAGDFNYQPRREQKRQPLGLSSIELGMAIESAKAVVGAKAGPHYPAPMRAIATFEQHASLHRDEAVWLESQGFVQLAQSAVAESLVGLFLKDQALKKSTKASMQHAADIKRCAVLGAGIMGGGIAYQAASTGTPIVMKDINDQALQAGLAEADKLFFKQVGRGKLTQAEAAEAMHRIVPTKSYGDFAELDLVVEAVVENPTIKAQVLAEVEAELRHDAVLCSNTSTISINTLAAGLQRPEQFCGMHFFNPVHRMPLVEVIRGEKTSDQAVASTVALAKRMGKSPIVVNDCPGFFVNRVLFPYFGGFNLLLNHGADFKRIDKLMERRFGWPMGPAYLLDVVGLDTAHHAAAVMAEGFPSRMSYGDRPIASSLVFEADWLGQKNGQGFYRYTLDKKGKPVKGPHPEVDAVLAQVVSETRELSDEQIVQRMMIPMCIETVRCLEEGIVASAAEADLGLIYGLGFPPFRGGVFSYLDTLGLDHFCQLCEQYAELGPLYQPTDGMKAQAASGQRYIDFSAPSGQ